MNCKLAQKNILGYIEKSLPSCLQTKIEIHLKECVTCSKLFENIALTYNFHTHKSIPQVSPFFYAKLVEKMKKKKDHNLQIIPKYIRLLQPVAAAVLIIFGIGFGVLIGKSYSNSNNSSFTKDELLSTYASEYSLEQANEENIVYSISK